MCGEFVVIDAAVVSLIGGGGCVGVVRGVGGGGGECHAMRCDVVRCGEEKREREKRKRRVDSDFLTFFLVVVSLISR
jgi:hypothetical protein